MTDYPDTNGNGVPDAFENRLSITEILSEDYGVSSDETVVVEIEKVARPPRAGEMYVVGSKVYKSSYDHQFPALVIRRIITGTWDVTKL